MLYFNTLADINYISNVDGEKFLKAIKAAYSSSIQNIHEYRSFEHKRKEYNLYTTMIIMENGMLLEIYVDNIYILHNGKQNTRLDEITQLANQQKVRERRKPLEINLLVIESGRIEMKPMEIKRSALNLELFYEDDFKVIDETIRKRLNNKNDKGIVLLHGLPGTGKTTYLRYLIGRIKKRVLFLAPNIANNLMNPGFIEILINNPNSVIVIEDAENIIMDRRSGNDSSVSNLLNISDGLLADFLNVQLICTFNSSLTLVDSALMRKGRLIAKYEFGKLSVAKAQNLSDHFGYNAIIQMPMTVAEISNQHEQNFETKQFQAIGFKRQEALLEN